MQANGAGAVLADLVRSVAEVAAVYAAAILPHPPLPLAGVSTAMERERVSRMSVPPMAARQGEHTGLFLDSDVLGAVRRIGEWVPDAGDSDD